MINKKVNDKEEKTSLTDNKEILKTKKFKKISLQKINLKIKPIKISISNKIEYSKLNSFISSKSKILSVISIAFIAFLAALVLLGKFHHKSNSDINDKVSNNSNQIPLSSSSKNKTISFLSPKSSSSENIQSPPNKKGVIPSNLDNNISSKNSTSYTKNSAMRSSLKRDLNQPSSLSRSNSSSSKH